MYPRGIDQLAANFEPRHYCIGEFSGEVAVTTRPAADSLFLIASVLRISGETSLNCLTIAGGVPAGATSATHPDIPKSRTVSAMVGTSGNSE